MLIIDSFIFYNEIDLLNYRLNLLNDIVDKFIIVESKYTFSGNEKPLFYDLNKEMFEPFKDKIVHIVLNEAPFKAPNINYQINQQWQNEYYQRNSIKLGIDSIISTLTDEDIIITSDVDEIPNPKILNDVKSNNIKFDKCNLNRLALDMYYYNLNYMVGKGSNWHGVKLLTVMVYKNLKLTFQDMRVWEHTHFVPIVENGGWHLSYFGDLNFIVNKIKSFSHQEYNNDKYIDEYDLEKKIKDGINFIGGLDLHFIPIEKNLNLPPLYEKYLTKYFT
jgi:beta-1,4-mannosyl-glycoprotein beta-1,4-N-acetylglucosaminyltransferase